MKSLILAITLALSSAAAMASDVELYEPDQVQMDSYILSSDTGKAYQVEIDRGSYFACYAKEAYRSFNYAEGSILVTREALMHPMNACLPGMAKEFQSGITLKIPASAQGYSTVRILVPGGAKVKLIQ